jgi:hypothetical protein
MTPRSVSFTRRAVLGSLVLGAATTSFAFARSSSGGASSLNETAMTIRVAFNAATMTAALDDNPSVRDFVSMLPLDLTIDNYANNEKISYLPRKLTEEGSGPFGDEAPGDLCYYAPWGNLVFFYAGYRYSKGLIRLGRIDGSFEPLLVRGKFDLRLELRPAENRSSSRHRQSRWRLSNEPDL